MSISSYDDNQRNMLNIDGNKENLSDTFDKDEQLNGSTEEEEETRSTSTISTNDDDEMNSNSEHNFDEEVGDETLRDDMEIVSSDDEMDYEMMNTSDDSFRIDSISDVLYNCRKIVNIINKSSILYEITQKLARPDIKHDLSVDMRIRWNSTCKMISNFNDYQNILNQLMEQLPSIQGVRAEQKNKLLKLQLPDAQWNIMKILESVLLVFCEGSEMLSGSKYPSYAMAYQVIDILNLYLQKSTIDPIEAEIKDTLLEALNRYVLYPPGSSEYNLMLVSLKTEILNSSRIINFYSFDQQRLNLYE